MKEQPRACSMHCLAILWCLRHALLQASRVACRSAHSLAAGAEAERLAPTRPLKRGAWQKPRVLPCRWSSHSSSVTARVVLCGEVQRAVGAAMHS